MPVVPTWRLAVLLAVAGLVVLLLPGQAGFTFAAVNLVVLAVAAVDAVRAPAASSFKVERDAPAILPLDGDGEVVWTVHNPARRPVRMRLADRLPPSLRAGSRRAALRVPAGGRARASTAISPSRRGRFELDTVTLRAEGPWRLAARQGDVGVPGTLRVYPPFRSRDEAELRIDKARILEVGLRSAQGRGGGTEFDQLREYGVDDEFRRIDWAATARAGKAIVRTYRAERNQTVMVLLDMGRLMAARVRDPQAGGASWGDVPRLDHAMDAVMMLTAVSTRLGDRAGFVAFSDRVHAAVAPGHTRNQLGRVTEAMYALESELVESDYRNAFSETLARFRRRSLLVVLTELVPEAVSETLLPALPLVVRNHLVLVAGVRDPSVDTWARATPADAREAYRKAAAVTALDARRRTVARLRALGVVVVDEPPGRLAPRLADAYLRVKATGRL
ncbi:MAG: DUF58 domain-containing protein [Euzebyales bacterium]|nr:DUF58 domain-containing protein [Euzebyales bacterium]